MGMACRVCGRDLERRWRRCVHCGAQNPRAESLLHSLFAYAVMAGLAAILVWMVLSG